MHQPPVARKIPRTTHIHDVTLHDDYYWLREREQPAVQAYLAAENAYLDTHLSASTRATLLHELQSRIVPDEQGAPMFIGTYTYQFRYMADRQYPTLVRFSAAHPQQVEVVCDLHAEAAGATFLKLGDWAVSPDEQYVALLLDHNGSERFTMHIRRISDGHAMIVPVPDLYYGLAWAADSTAIAFVRPDEAWRPCSVWVWPWQQAVSTAACIFHEPNELFNVELAQSGDMRFFIVNSQSSSTSESWIFDSTQQLPAHCVAARISGVKYTVEMRGTQLFVCTNADAENNRIVTTQLGAQQWHELVAHRTDTFIEQLSVFATTCVLWVRRAGLQQAEIYADDGTRHDIQFADAAYMLAPSHAQRYDGTIVYFGYTTPITPLTTIAYDMHHRRQTVIHQYSVADTHTPDDYVLERVFASSSDGVQVPLTIVRHRDVRCDGTAPALLIGYGAYGANLSVGFVAERLSLLQRGVIIALAHIRGGSELGKAWYLDGKLAHKQHTFDDFIACAEYLIAQHYTSPQRLACRGRSAGGLLVGAVVTQRPELFAAAVALVPFVDVINTLLDPSIPLTIPEYEEWGNPNIPNEFHTILAYSPYDNTRARRYPAMLLTAGFNDPRVPYWEPAKWIAKLRALAPEGRYFLMTDMYAGHAGKSGRYDALIDTALEYAFLCDTLAVPVA